LNIAEDLLGKEVIDDSGIVMGVVKDVTWDFENNRIESLVVEKGGGGFLSFGSGEKTFVSYENIHSIGDKVLVNIKVSQSTENKENEEEKDEFGLNRIGLRL
jgi:sporulation protein YlmC with PRC-barrel domain